MTRIAQLHFTSAPSVGGVEDLIDRQTEVLLGRGVEVRYIVADGEAPPGADMVRIPELHPRVGATAGLRAMLEGALRGCDQCWVHNILTLDLHPDLVDAVADLMARRAGVRWIIWAYDLSNVSAFAGGLDRKQRELVRAVTRDATVVTISEARRREVAAFLDRPESTVRVVTPPLDLRGWLGLDAETVALDERLGLAEAWPVVLVPAKVLPHKNLDLAVHVAAELDAERPLMLLSAAASPHQPGVSAEGLRGLRALIAELAVTDRVQMLPEVLGRTASRRVMRDLMLLSDVVFVPSKEEGYGMPVLEAVALRAPILCSDIPAFREAGGEAATFFSEDETPGEIAERITGLAGQRNNRARQQAVRSWAEFDRQISALAAERVTE